MVKKINRLPWEILHNGGWGMFEECPYCEESLHNEAKVRECWVKGHFDFKERKK